MKYSYQLVVIDDVGNTVIEHELTADEAVQILAPHVRRADTREHEVPAQAKTREPKPGKRSSTCSICGKPGHNVVTCPKGKGQHPKNLRDPHTEGKPCCGSVGPRHKKGCASGADSYRVSPASKDIGEEISSFHREKQEPTPMTAEQYSGLRDAMQDREFMSASYALSNKISPREVNIAVRSADYEDYLLVR